MADAIALPETGRADVAALGFNLGGVLVDQIAAWLRVLGIAVWFSPGFDRRTCDGVAVLAGVRHIGKPILKSEHPAAPWQVLNL